MNTLKKGWILTGVYCAAAVTPGISAMLGFMLAWGLIISAGAAFMLSTFVLQLVWPGATDNAKAGVAIALAILLVPVPTFVNAWIKAPQGRRLNAVLQVAAMWLLAAGATWLASRALADAWP